MFSCRDTEQSRTLDGSGNNWAVIDCGKQGDGSLNSEKKWMTQGEVKIGFNERNFWLRELKLRRNHFVVLCGVTRNPSRVGVERALVLEGVLLLLCRFYVFEYAYCSFHLSTSSFTFNNPPGGYAAILIHLITTIQGHNLLCFYHIVLFLR